MYICCILCTWISHCHRSGTLRVSVEKTLGLADGELKPRQAKHATETMKKSGNVLTSLRHFGASTWKGAWWIIFVVQICVCFFGTVCFFCFKNGDWIFECGIESNLQVHHHPRQSTVDQILTIFECFVWWTFLQTWSSMVDSPKKWDGHCSRLHPFCICCIFFVSLIF